VDAGIVATAGLLPPEKQEEVSHKRMRSKTPKCKMVIHQSLLCNIPTVEFASEDKLAHATTACHLVAADANRIGRSIDNKHDGQHRVVAKSATWRTVSETRPPPIPKSQSSEMFAAATTTLTREPRGEITIPSSAQSNLDNSVYSESLYISLYRHVKHGASNNGSTHH
jgi:hypothetical protein